MVDTHDLEVREKKSIRERAGGHGGTGGPLRRRAGPSVSGVRVEKGRPAAREAPTKS